MTSPDESPEDKIRRLEARLRKVDRLLDELPFDIARDLNRIIATYKRNEGDA